LYLTVLQLQYYSNCLLASWHPGMGGEKVNLFVLLPRLFVPLLLRRREHYPLHALSFRTVTSLPCSQTFANATRAFRREI
jgi:hypothetical protein